MLSSCSLSLTPCPRVIMELCWYVESPQRGSALWLTTASSNRCSPGIQTARHVARWDILCPLIFLLTSSQLLAELFSRILSQVEEELLISVSFLQVCPCVTQRCYKFRLSTILVQDNFWCVSLSVLSRWQCCGCAQPRQTDFNTCDAPSPRKVSPNDGPQYINKDKIHNQYHRKGEAGDTLAREIVFSPRSICFDLVQLDWIEGNGVEVFSALTVILVYIITMLLYIEIIYIIWRWMIVIFWLYCDFFMTLLIWWESYHD